MVAQLSAWVKNILLIVLFATFLELLLPHSHMRSFVRVIMGLFIMLSILQPILDVMESRNGPIHVTALSVDDGRKLGDIRRNTQQAIVSREQVIREIYCQDLAKQIGVTVAAVEGVADNRVEIRLQSASNVLTLRDVVVDNVTVSITPGSKQEQRISKVAISKSSEDTILEPTLKKRVVKMISELYQIPSDKIIVKPMLQGGLP